MTIGINIGLPDYWIRGRLPESLHGPFQVRFSFTILNTQPFNRKDIIPVWIPQKNQTLIIYNVQAFFSENSLFEVALRWGDTYDPEEDVIYLTGERYFQMFGYGSAKMDIPKGIDYSFPTPVILEVTSYSYKPVDLRIVITGLINLI